MNCFLVHRRTGQTAPRELLFALLTLLFLLTLTPFLSTIAKAQNANVLTRHNDLQRTGQYLAETTLKPSNISLNKFGKLYSRPLDGELYTQPLFAAGITFAGNGVHNAVFLATAHNTVYAFDADSNTGANANSLWQINLGPSVPSSVINTPNLPIEVGIIGTPVINIETKTLYVVTKNYFNNVQSFRLHALNLESGAEKFGGSVAITATVLGRADGGTTVKFRPEKENQRPALTLVGNNLYVGFAGHEDYYPYHGWVFAFNATTLQQTAVHCNTPNGNGGGIWMSGDGFAADANGNIYYVGGNGDYDGTSNFGEAVVKLTPSLGVADWFAPFDFNFLNSIDYDLSSSNAIGLPGTNLIAAGAKNGKVYLLNTNNMGKFRAGADSQIVQWFQASGGHIHSSMLYYNSPTRGRQIYIWGENDVLKAWSFNGSQFVTAPVDQSKERIAPGYANGPGMSISANGTVANTGILWSSLPLGDAVHAQVPGILRAYDANNLSVELWNSQQNPGRDEFGKWAKWCPPTIANGKVYLSTLSNQLCVYGLLPPPPPGTGSVIGINFVGGGPNGVPGAMASSETAGVVSKGSWNSVGFTQSGSLSGLLDDSGGIVGTAVTWSADGLGSLPGVDAPGNRRMMKGYLDSGAGKNTSLVTVTGLSNTYTSGGYDVYVYSDGDNGAVSRTGVYSIGTANFGAEDVPGANFAGTFKQATNSSGNYVVFRNLTGSSFTLKATPRQTGTNQRAPLNGIQIVARKATPFTVTIDSVSTGAAYKTVVAKTSVAQYIDRKFNITNLTYGIANGVLIQTAGNDWEVKSASHLTFTVSSDATVYVCYDPRSTKLPAWLDATWTLTTEKLVSTDTGASPMKVYSKNFPGGKVVLGGNLQLPAAGALSNYVVVVQPR